MAVLDIQRDDRLPVGHLAHLDLEIHVQMAGDEQPPGPEDELDVVLRIATQRPAQHRQQLPVRGKALDLGFTGVFVDVVRQATVLGPHAAAERAH